MEAAPARCQPGDPEALPALLVELERVLVDEATALRKLDRTALDRVVEAKQSLCDRIAGAGRAGSEHRPALERIKQSALRNQMLLAHAQGSVRQVIALATGQTASPSFGGLRLDVRG